MPIHEYDCSDCNNRFEDLVGTFQNFPEPTNCRYCQSPRITKAISVPSPAVLPYSTPEAEEEARKNNKYLESDPEVRSGARQMFVPKGMPPRLQPKFK